MPPPLYFVQITKRLTVTDLTNVEVVRLVAWSSGRVDKIHRTYVDDSRLVVAIGSGSRRVV
jgi:hypothetical protein